MAKKLRRRSKRSRLVLSACAGVTIAVLTILAGWREASYSALYGSRHDTFTTLGSWHRRLESHLEQGEPYPTSTAQLAEIWHAGTWNQHAKKKPISLDGWGHPLEFELSEDHFDVVSRGLDGVPGGTGLNFDMRMSEIKDDYDFPYRWVFKPAGAQLTLFDFVLRSKSERSILMALLSGAAAAWLGYRLLLVRNKRTLLGTAVVLCFSLLLAAALTTLHLPVVSGH